ncbi:uncharacterized protein LOC128399859 isoform X3 [Podarcis raffonei]|uniref:uncharacterized protein LOC128399859 isoform X3 n=1 Tax=Podarcis raffonei TaxID=65483 RepID=UPI00232994A0|nr:uncharacterized protein LOC128399859 isoform X3 [Podarcis raffonei]
MLKAPKDLGPNDCFFPYKPSRGAKISRWGPLGSSTSLRSLGWLSTWKNIKILFLNNNTVISLGWWLREGHSLWQPQVVEPPPPRASTPACPKAPPPACSTPPPLSTHQCKKPSRRAAYHPFDFTSDELDPAYEWPRESSSARQSGVDVIPLLRSTLGQFPLGLRLDKLEALVWKEHKVKLWKLCLERGYSDSLKFLEVLPGIRLKPSGKGTFRCLVLLDPGEKWCGEADRGSDRETWLQIPGQL